MPGAICDKQSVETCFDIDRPTVADPVIAVVDHEFTVDNAAPSP